MRFYSTKKSEPVSFVYIITSSTTFDQSTTSTQHSSNSNANGLLFSVTTHAIWHKMMSRRTMQYKSRSDPRPASMHYLRYINNIPGAVIWSTLMYWPVSHVVQEPVSFWKIRRFLDWWSGCLGRLYFFYNVALAHEHIIIDNLALFIMTTTTNDDDNDDMTYQLSCYNSAMNCETC